MERDIVGARTSDKVYVSNDGQRASAGSIKYLRRGHHTIVPDHYELLSRGALSRVITEVTHRPQCRANTNRTYYTIRPLTRISLVTPGAEHLRRRKRVLTLLTVTARCAHRAHHGEVSEHREQGGQGDSRLLYRQVRSPSS